jgi:hypothetical protein
MEAGLVTSLVCTGAAGTVPAKRTHLAGVWGLLQTLLHMGARPGLGSPAGTGPQRAPSLASTVG